eukprot:gene12642-16950_t
MNDFLCKLPEHLLRELFREWLVIIKDISAIDLALCSGLTRDYLMRIISESSMRYPLDSHDIFFSNSFLLWLMERRLFVNALYIDDYDKQQLFDFKVVLNNISPSIININHSSCVSTRLSKKNEIKSKMRDIFNRIENICFCFENELFKIHKQLSRICTNLKELSFYGSVNDTALYSILEPNSYCLTKLELLNCFEIELINLPNTLFKNIETLIIYQCANVKDFGWNMMSNGLTNLKNLTFRPCSSNKLRSLSNLIHLKYFAFEFDDFEDFLEFGDLSEILFPKYLDKLIIMNPQIDLQLQTLFSNNLHNLKHLEIIGGDTYSSFVSSPLFPQSLASLDISLLNIQFSMAAMIQMFSVKYNMFSLTKDGIAKVILPSSLTSLFIPALRGFDENSIIEILSNNNLSNLIALELICVDTRKNIIFPNWYDVVQRL